MATLFRAGTVVTYLGATEKGTMVVCGARLTSDSDGGATPQNIAEAHVFAQAVNTQRSPGVDGFDVPACAQSPAQVTFGGVGNNSIIGTTYPIGDGIYYTPGTSPYSKTNVTGPAGAAGVTGPTGAIGPTGPTGP
jgi:hypothetical protein